MSISLKYGETTVGIPFDLSKYLVSINKTIGDRTALTFMLKSDPTALDGSAEYNITEGAALVVSGDTVTAYITTFGSLAVDTSYFIGLGIQFTGDSSYREIPLRPASKNIVFTQDVIRG